MARETLNDIESFAKEQARVRKSAMAALLASLIALMATWFFGAGWPVTAASDADRLAFVFRCELAIGFVLWAMIARVGAIRYFSPADIGGAASGTETKEIAVARAALQNTIEQSVLAIIAHSALALTLPANRMAVIIALVGLFVIGRIAYWFGYPKGAAVRAFGFALTFYPTIIGLSAALVFTLI